MENTQNNQSQEQSQTAPAAPAPQQAAAQPQASQTTAVQPAVAPGWRKRISARFGRAKAAIAWNWYRIAVVALLATIAVLLACGCGRKAPAREQTREEQFAEYLRLLNQREVRELTPEEDNKLLELGNKIASEPPAWSKDPSKEVRHE